MTARVTPKSAFFALVMSVAVSLQGCGEEEAAAAKTDPAFAQFKKDLEAKLSLATYTQCFPSKKDCINEHAGDIDSAKKTAELALKAAETKGDKDLLSKATWDESKQDPKDPVGCLWATVELNKMFAKEKQEPTEANNKDRGGCGLKFDATFLKSECEEQGSSDREVAPKTDAEKKIEEETAAEKKAQEEAAAKKKAEEEAAADAAAKKAEEEAAAKKKAEEEAAADAAAKKVEEVATKTDAEQKIEEEAAAVQKAEVDAAEETKAEEEAAAETKAQEGTSGTIDSPALLEVSLLEEGKVHEKKSGEMAPIGAHSFMQKQ
jgi:hypothetical protein